MSVLAILLSAITWVPGLLLFAFKAYLDGFGWFRDELVDRPWPSSSGSWVWIVTLCLLALAMSAWVKWRVAAGALIFGIFFVAAGFGEAINQRAAGLRPGCVLNIAAVIEADVVRCCSGGTAPAIPRPLAWSALFCFCGVVLLPAREETAGLPRGAVMSGDQKIVFENVSKFYGDVLGVNGVNLSIAPGITTLVGPNGSGKTTLMNLMTGLVRPTRGSIRVLGLAPSDAEHLFRAARLLHAVRFVPARPHRLRVHRVLPAAARHERRARGGA